MKNYNKKRKVNKFFLRTHIIFAFLFAIFNFALFIFIAPTIEAAGLYFDTDVHEVGVGQRLEVHLRVDSEGETINTLEGTIHIPAHVSIKEIRDGDSLIAFWVERPTVDGGTQVRFAGIIPSGWKGEEGSLFSFIIEAVTEGTDMLALADAQALLHDGKGTKTVTRTNTLALTVDESIEPIDLVKKIDDAVPPESFTLYLADDAEIFNGDYFLVFTAQDKGSGIDHYEAQETSERLVDERGGDWNRAESPYRIKDQTLKSFVYVKAVDRAGNFRVTLFKPVEEVAEEPIFAPTVSRVLKIVIAVVILLVLGVVLFIIRRRKLKDTDMDTKKH